MTWKFDKSKWENKEPGFLSSMGTNIGIGLANVGSDAAKGIGAFIKGQQGKYYPDGNAPESPEVDWFMEKGKNLREWADEQSQKYGPRDEYRSMGVMDRLTTPKYLTDPRGLTADVFQGVGSSAPFLLASTAAGGAPIIGGGLRTISSLPGLVTRAGLSKIGSRGLNNFVNKTLVPTIDTGAYYAMTTAPMDAYINSAGIYDSLKKQGYSDAEIYNRMMKMTSEEIPYDVGFNAINGVTLFGKGFGTLGRTAPRRVAASALNVPVDMTSEYLQEGNQERLQRKYSNLPYTKNLLEGFQYPEELESARAGSLGAVGMGVGGVVKTGYNEIQSERAKNKDFQKAVPQLHDWAKEISGNSNADEVVDLILKNAKKLNYTPEQTKLALALAAAESNLNQNAISKQGAIGVMQLIPETAKELGVDPYKLEENIYGGLKYLKDNLDAFDGDWQKAAAAYNAGPGAVEKYGGIPPYSETLNYVSRIGNLLEGSPEIGSEDENESILGVDDYEMTTQSSRIGEQVKSLKSGWEKAIPQIGGALKYKFGLTPVISSAARTAEHNAEVGGSETSHHIIRKDGGDALDIVFAEDLTEEQQNRIAEYFKGTGLFKEILYHDVGSGAHLHLGGLNVDKLTAKKIKVSDNETDSEIETPAEDSYFVDDVLKNLLSQNTPPNFKIERQTPLTRAVYKDFVSSKLQDSSDAESEINKKFFEQHPEFFNKDGEFIHNDKNRAALAQEFGSDEISDFGQKLIADRIDAIRNIQSPKDSLNFKTSEFEDKNGNKTYISEIAGTLPKGVRKEIENLATEYGGAIKKGGKFNFANAETRDNFVVDAESYIQSLQAPNIVNPVTPPTQSEIKPAENIQPAQVQTEIQPAENIQPAKKSGKDFIGEGETVEEAETRAINALAKALGLEGKIKENISNKNSSNEDKAKVETKDDGKLHLKSPKFADNSKENRERVIAELKKKLSKVSANPMFNPRIYSLGLELGAIYIQDGVDSVTEWTNKMVNSVGEEISRWLPAIQTTINAIPEDAKFDNQQISYIAQYIGVKIEAGKVISFEEALAEFEKDLGKENAAQFKPMFKAAYLGIEKFFAENKAVTAETKKASNKDFELAEGYRTESGRDLQEADSQEFIIKPDGSKDFGRISEDIAEKANARIKELGLEGEVKAAPIRLQVGIPDTEFKDGFGYVHIIPHIDSIKSRGFENIPAYIEHILNNFNQMYKSNTGDRIVLYCKGDKSKGLMPLDLELEKSTDDEYYTIVTVYPRRRANKNDTLILDTRPHKRIC